jgi:hypothetical protein
MKKLLLILLLCLLILPSYGIGRMVVGSGGGGGPTYTDILFWWTCESANIGAGDYSAGDTTGTVFSAATFDVTAVKLGTNGLDCPTSGDSVRFVNASSNILVESAGRIGFWLQVKTWVAGIFIGTLNSTGVFNLQLYGTDELQFRYNDGTNDRWAITTTANLVVDTWYYIEIAWDVSTELQKIFVDGVEKASNTQTKNATVGMTNIDIGSGGTMTLWIDNFVISNDPNRNLYLLKDIDNYPG